MTTKGRKFIIQDRGDIVEDPDKRVLAAVVLRAVRDYFLPAKDITNAERESAAAFLWSEEGRLLLAYFLKCGQEATQNKLIEAKERFRRLPNAETS
jgi:hypothetical protein